MLGGLLQEESLKMDFDDFVVLTRRWHVVVVWAGRRATFCSVGCSLQSYVFSAEMCC